ncbi:hypothetical protein A2U01_0079682 [Trifolium medium]|uniref:Uncharacterized protein n=1 Tax=Trifolium medium TaxID=97028 RepID=A0A392TDC2_9FABA|nr:hypothetical protein [Trifolium medium]
MRLRARCTPPLLRKARPAEAARGSSHASRAVPALAALRANTSRFTRIFTDFVLPRFQGTFNNSPPCL